MFACFFQTNFPIIPFLKPKLLSFLVVYVVILLLFLGFMFHVSAFLFWCWLCFWYLYFVLVLFCFVYCFAFTHYEKHCFPCNSIVSLVMLVTRQFFSVSCFGSCLFFSCGVCFQFKHSMCIIVCLCCLVFLLKNRTKWFCCLHLVVFLFFVVLFWILSFLFIPLKKRPPQKRTQQRPKKAKMPKKTKKENNQLAQLCPQIVFLFWGVG